MSSFSLHEHLRPSRLLANDRQITIVLYSVAQDIEAIARSIAKYLRNNPAPAKVAIFGLSIHRIIIEEILGMDSPVRQRLEVSWGSSGKSNSLVGFVRSTDVSQYEAIGELLSSDEIEIEAQLAATMTAQAIFNMSRCVQIAPRGIHYSKTSKAHSSSFIRASSALIRSSDTLTLAYWLQPFFSQTAKRILVDTSAVASVVYAGCQIAIASGQLTTMPIIESFQSYEGLSDEDLLDVENTLFVISASTSGNLAREAFQKGVDRERLITIFLLAEPQKDQNSLCLLARSKSNPDGHELIKSWKSSDCALCRDGSSAIQIGGDLFLTALPATIEVAIAKRHLPETQSAVISKFSGLGLFRVHRRIGDRTCEFSIDISSLISGSTTESAEVKDFQDDWDRLLRRFLPANVTNFSYPSYPNGEQLVESVLSYASQYIKSDIDKRSSLDIKDAPILVSGCAVIVTPCIDDPVEIMGMNRDFRTIIPGGTATYLAPFFRARSVEHAKATVSNLTYGDRGAMTYSLHKMYELFLPEDRDTDPWDAELRLLMELSEWLEDQDGGVPAEILKRCEVLRNSTAQGLIDDLFWPNSVGKRLEIRSNFVLLPTDDGARHLFQADIFFVISALLNNLRQATGKESLHRSEYERKLLSPTNFIRFNDGIIQAAILRAARDDELNFVASDTNRYSQSMMDLLLKMIVGAGSEDGEALTEFVLAIAVCRIRLDKDHCEIVINKLISCEETIPKIAFCMARFIKSKTL